jgi:hypothetical protein
MKKNKYIKKFRIILVTFSGLISIFFFSSIVSAATTNTTINSTLSSLISLSSTGSVTLNVLPTGSGSQTIGNDTVVVSTNDNAGYTLTLADSSSNNSLISGSNSIPASSGTQANPVVQTSNTWGYCVPNVGGFGVDCPSTSNSNQAISSTNKFAGVPINSSPNIIASTSVSAVNSTTTVWYAVTANTSQNTGTYSSTVTYTATAN